MKQLTRDVAMRALLAGDGATLTEIATTAGLSRRTIYSVLRDEEFRQEYRAQREAQAVQRAAELATARQAAIDTVLDIMGDTMQPGTVRLAAAKAVLSAESEAQGRLTDVLSSAEFDADWEKTGKF